MLDRNLPSMVPRILGFSVREIRSFRSQRFGVSASVSSAACPLIYRSSLQLYRILRAASGSAIDDVPTGVCDIRVRMSARVKVNPQAASQLRTRHHTQVCGLVSHLFTEVDATCL